MYDIEKKDKKMMENFSNTAKNQCCIFIMKYLKMKSIWLNQTIYSKSINFFRDNCRRPFFSLSNPHNSFVTMDYFSKLVLKVIPSPPWAYGLEM